MRARIERLEHANAVGMANQLDDSFLGRKRLDYRVGAIGKHVDTAKRKRVP
jgi:hypothetical protein